MSHRLFSGQKLFWIADEQLKFSKGKTYHVSTGVNYIDGRVNHGTIYQVTMYSCNLKGIYVITLDQVEQATKNYKLDSCIVVKIINNQLRYIAGIAHKYVVDMCYEADNSPVKIDLGSIPAQSLIKSKFVALQMTDLWPGLFTW